MRYKITDKFEIHGIWSSSSDFKEYQIGKVIYDYSTGSIELEFSHSELKMGKEFDVIYGIDSRNKYISLLNVRVSHTKGSNIKYTKMFVESMIIDSKPWSGPDTHAIYRVYFSFEGLDKFLPFNNWKKGIENKEFIKNEETFYEYNIEILNATLKEHNRFGYHLSGSPSSEYRLYNEPILELEFSKKVDLVHANQVIFKIRQLMAFFVGESLPLKFIEFDSKTSDISGNEMPFIGSYYIRQVIGDKKYKQILAPYRREELIDNFDSVLNNYFENYEKIRSIMQNHLGDLVMNNYSETLFLNACTNLEVFHREVIRANKEISQELTDFYNKILEIAKLYNEEIQSDIERIINDAKKVNLKQRLSYLIKDMPNELKDKILFSDYKQKISDFTYFTSNTRNHLTHGSIINDNKTFKLEQLNDIKTILEIILEYHLMSYLGLDDRIIISGIRNNSSYHRVMTNLYNFQSSS